MTMAAATSLGFKACAIQRHLTRTHITQSLSDCQPAPMLLGISNDPDGPAKSRGQHAGCPEKPCAQNSSRHCQEQPFHTGRQAGEDVRGPQMLSKSQLAGAAGASGLGNRVSLAQRFPRAQAAKGNLWTGTVGWASCALPARLFPDLSGCLPVVTQVAAQLSFFGDV